MDESAMYLLQDDIGRTTELTAEEMDMILTSLAFVKHRGCLYGQRVVVLDSLLNKLS